MADILDCKKVANSIKQDCLEQCSSLKKLGISPKLAILRVGANPSDLAYERGAKATMADIGAEVEVVELPEDVSEEKYIETMKELNERSDIHGILPFRPLANINEREAISETILPSKDVDSTTDENMGKIILNDDTALFPCTAMAIMEVLDYYNISVKGKNIVVLNNSNVIGKPVSMMLTNRFATVSICHVFTEDVSDYTSRADILICAVPVKNLVKGYAVKPGAVVIDATVIREKVVDENGNPVINEATGRQKVVTLGCLADDVQNVAGAVTPVPGVGSVTSANLAKNLVKACTLQTRI